jgi:hypothetical protein
MLCESVCKQLSSWDNVLLSSVRFCEIMFQWSGDFLQLIWRSKESALNCVSVFKELLQKPTECYRKPSEIMPSAKAELFLWYKRLKEERTSVDDDECSERPSTSTTQENIAIVRGAILADRRRTIYNVCEIVELSYGTVQRMLADNLWEAFLRILWQDCWATTRSPSRFCLQGTQTTSQRLPQIHLHYHNRWRNIGVCLWPWD